MSMIGNFGQYLPILGFTPSPLVHAIPRPSHGPAAADRINVVSHFHCRASMNR
jgi:hypothetical protein